ncbi:hypothetical protein ACQPXM_01735 [Kribbella sp. CA-253562]|uniref:hypothetical protein n=1 Tax=Kribbella sp. CA-253562 TaxID=3239942 RepID=UPI003D8E8CB4
MTSTQETGRVGVEWGGRPSDEDLDATDWPRLQPSARCDGENPMTGRACVNGYHQGYHRDSIGAEWLDD